MKKILLLISLFLSSGALFSQAEVRPVAPDTAHTSKQPRWRLQAGSVNFEQPVSLAEFRKQTTVQVMQKDGENWIPVTDFPIISYTFHCAGKKAGMYQVVFNSNRLDAIQFLLKDLQEGDFIMFTNIKIQTAAGDAYLENASAQIIP
ncbi:MAG: hypothetical protein JNL57_09455 [Bacteroidetes bacterium]|nr:hypothetical protein [Bacteroidota bacterium]